LILTHGIQSGCSLEQSCSSISIRLPQERIHVLLSFETAKRYKIVCGACTITPVLQDSLPSITENNTSHQLSQMSRILLAKQPSSCSEYPCHVAPPATNHVPVPVGRMSVVEPSHGPRTRFLPVECTHCSHPFQS
jgi:hypothetical protein